MAAMTELEAVQTIRAAGPGVQSAWFILRHRIACYAGVDTDRVQLTVKGPHQAVVASLVDAKAGTVLVFGPESEGVLEALWSLLDRVVARLGIRDTYLSQEDEAAARIQAEALGLAWVGQTPAAQAMWAERSRAMYSPADGAFVVQLTRIRTPARSEGRGEDVLEAFLAAQTRWIAEHGALRGGWNPWISEENEDRHRF